MNHYATLLDEDHASEPRKRLAQLLFYNCANVDVLPASETEGEGKHVTRHVQNPKPKPEVFEREIIRLARDHPEIFEKDFKQRRGHQTSIRCSPLATIMSFQNSDHRGLSSTLVSANVFEAACSAHPESLTAVDSYGDTILRDLIRHHEGNDPQGHAAWFALVKRVVEKNPAQLAIKTPIIYALDNNLPLEVICYLIDRHPGDPYREVGASNKETMLWSVVAKPALYPFEFVKEVFDKNPDAAKAQNIGRYNETMLHQACNFENQARTIRLLLNGDPAAACVAGRDRNLPLFNLIKSMPTLTSYAEWCSSLELLAPANPRAAFITYMQRGPSSGFSLIVNSVLRDKGDNRGWGSNEQVDWKLLFFLMHVYRYGNVSEAWKEPPFPLHMAASCPCPSKLLLHLADKHPEHLLMIDSVGRSVLALALESGHSMSPVSGNMYCFCRKLRVEKCVQKLVEMDAAALGLRDPQTQLYPFQTAATMESSIFDMLALDNSYYRPDMTRDDDNE